MANIALVGEAWGAEEAKERRPFVGTTGAYLNRMLSAAGIHRGSCLITNVFNLRPRENKIANLCGPKKDALPGYPPITGGKYIRKEFAPELERLAEELIDADPNILILLGNVPMWALLGKTKIKNFRGCIDTSTHTASGFKVLPTYHPASILPGRMPENRPVIIADFMKALRESAYPEVRRPDCQIWIEPTLEDLERFYDQHLRRSSLISVDIETTGTRITCIGFSNQLGCAIVIPFDDPRSKTRSYWDSNSAERKAWVFVKRILELPCRKLFQNGLYDIAFLWRAMKIRVINASEDTMLLHHALQPESPKALGFLGSLYTDHGAWKHLREVDTIKRDD